jgi:hypothetical protein
MIPNTESELKEIVSQRILTALNELLEKKHLYQSVSISSDGLDEIIQKGIEDYKKEIRRAGPTSSSRPSTAEENARAISELLNRKLLSLLNGCWDFIPEIQSNVAGPPIQLYGQGLPPLLLSSIRVSCNSGKCKGTIQPHNSGYPSLQAGLGSGNLSKSLPTIQIFSLWFECQNCKEKPLIFLVKREGLKLILVGRSEFPEILVPNFIPDAQRKFYRNAVIANQTNFTLAAALYLRTLIEQHFYQVIPKKEIDAIKEKGNPRGDELADLYADTLAENFPANCPSLKKAYNDLSEILHSGKEDDDVKQSFNTIRVAVETHFETVQLFKKLPTFSA